MIAMCGIAALISCQKEEQPEEPTAAVADVDVIPRLREFISLAADGAQDRVGDPISLDSAEWYIEGALNYSLSQAWVECTEQTTDSIEVSMPSGTATVEGEDAAATFTQLATAVSSMLSEDVNHLIVADVVMGEPANGSVNVLVIVDIGSGYERYEGLITSYGPDDYWYAIGGWVIENCGCGPNVGAAGYCADYQIMHRLQQVIAHPADCFYTDVQSRYVNVNQPDLDTYWVSQQFPTGIPDTPYLVFWCQNAFLCNTCFEPERMEFYTQGMYDVMLTLQPSQKEVISASVGSDQTLEEPELTRYWHNARFRYGRQNCRR